ncbi:hypothetical protein Tco_0205345 [Tanacetum coccineum]
MKGFATNDQADYYSGITSIMVNGKNAYELKGKFLDDLHKNAFSGTNGEDTVKHIKYFLEIVDPIDLPNINQDKLRVVFFPISLVGDAWRWFDGIKGSITSWVDLTDKFLGKYYPSSRTGKVNTSIIKWDLTNPEFENWLASKFVNYMTMDIFTKGAFNYGVLEWPTYSWRKDGYGNGGNLPGAYIIGNTLCYQDLEWYDALKDSELKEEALRNKAIMEGLINEDNEHEDDERQEVCSIETHELSVFTIRIFEMIKYSFGQDKEYVAIKEDEYEELTRTSKDACQAYQEIFCMMDEGWMDLVVKKSTMLVKYLQYRNLEVLES